MYKLGHLLGFSLSYNESRNVCLTDVLFSFWGLVLLSNLVLSLLMFLLLNGCKSSTIEKLKHKPSLMNG